jgi:hypothetical protein
MNMNMNMSVIEMNEYYMPNADAIRLYSASLYNVSTVVSIITDAIIKSNVNFRCTTNFAEWTCIYNASPHIPPIMFEIHLLRQCGQLFIEPKQLSGTKWGFKTVYNSIIEYIRRQIELAVIQSTCDKFAELF